MAKNSDKDSKDILPSSDDQFSNRRQIEDETGIVRSCVDFKESTSDLTEDSEFKNINNNDRTTNIDSPSAAGLNTRKKFFPSPLTPVSQHSSHSFDSEQNGINPSSCSASSSIDSAEYQKSLKKLEQQLQKSMVFAMKDYNNLAETDDVKEIIERLAQTSTKESRSLVKILQKQVGAYKKQVCKLEREIVEKEECILSYVSNKKEEVRKVEGNDNSSSSNSSCVKSDTELNTTTDAIVDSSYIPLNDVHSDIETSPSFHNTPLVDNVSPEKDLFPTKDTGHNHFLLLSQEVCSDFQEQLSSTNSKLSHTVQKLDHTQEDIAAIKVRLAEVEDHVVEQQTKNNEVTKKNTNPVPEIIHHPNLFRRQSTQVVSNIYAVEEEEEIGCMEVKADGLLQEKFDTAQERIQSLELSKKTLSDRSQMDAIRIKKLEEEVQTLESKLRSGGEGSMIMAPPAPVFSPASLSLNTNFENDYYENPNGSMLDTSSAIFTSPLSETSPSFFTPRSLNHSNSSSSKNRYNYSSRGRNLFYSNTTSSTPTFVSSTPPQPPSHIVDSACSIATEDSASYSYDTHTVTSTLGTGSLTNITQTTHDSNPSVLVSELKNLSKKSFLQREHNAQLLQKITNLSGYVQVCCRIRPMSANEIDEHDYETYVEPWSETEIGCRTSSDSLMTVAKKRRSNEAQQQGNSKRWQSFSFDKVWGPDLNQLHVCQDVEPFAMSVIDGYNCCVLAYGSR